MMYKKGPYNPKAEAAKLAKNAVEKDRIENALRRAFEAGRTGEGLWEE